MFIGRDEIAIILIVVIVSATSGSGSGPGGGDTHAHAPHTHPHAHAHSRRGEVTPHATPQRRLIKAANDKLEVGTLNTYWIALIYPCASAPLRGMTGKN